MILTDFCWGLKDAPDPEGIWEEAYVEMRGQRVNQHVALERTDTISLLLSK